VPSVVLPFAADQFFWADQLLRIGIAPVTTSVQRATAASLSHAIGAAGTPEIREKASAVGAKMRMEDGLTEAVETVHGLLARSGRQGK
jgi:UDP:flavonoid glycosyltransferase YjiC (YdhE family)